MIVKPTKNSMGRTISRDLITWLTFTMVIIVTVIGFFYYSYAVSIAKKDLENYANQVSTEFSHSIALPMSNFEIETVRYIANVLLQAESLVGIRVTVDTTTLFEYLPDSMTGVFSKKNKVVWKDETVGATELLFTRINIKKERKTLITLIALILSCVILTITLTTRTILKSFLNNPLQDLTKGIQKIADGDYTSPLDMVVHNDINIIVDKINQMASQIKKRSHQVYESEKKYRTIFENAVEGLYKTSSDNRLLNANPALATILGYDSPDEMIQNITDIGSHIYVRPQLRQELLGQLEMHDIVKAFEMEVYRKDKSRIWVESNTRAIRDSAGKLIGQEGSIVDINNRKQMERDLRKAHDELELRIKERTHELEEKTAKLERINKLFVDRELRMKELKVIINDLQIKLSEKKDHEMNKPG